MSKQSKSKQSKASKAIAAPVVPSDLVGLQSEVQRVFEAVRDAASPKLKGQKIGKTPITLPTGRVVVNVESTLGSRAKRSTVYGHFAPNRWTDNGETVHQIALSPYFLGREQSEIVATMAHEWLHLVAQASDIKDTSRQGRFHSATYAALVALVPNLLVEGPRSRQIGVTTEPSPECKTWVAEELHPQFGAVSKLLEAARKPTPPNRVRFVCDCGNKAIVAVKQANEGFVPLCGHDHAARPMTLIAN